MGNNKTYQFHKRNSSKEINIKIKLTRVIGKDIGI